MSVVKKNLHDGGFHWVVKGSTTIHRNENNGPAVYHPAESMMAGEYYYLYGMLHRNNGPAMITSLGKIWYLFDLMHREDGPAVEFPDGGKQYWFDGIRVDVDTDRKFKKYVKAAKSIKL